jgi:hypothetical protein
VKVKQTTPTQEPKQAKTYTRTEHYQAIAIWVLASAIIFTIGGYFLSINVIGEARQNVVRDMQLVSKEQSR